MHHRDTATSWRAWRRACERTIDGYTPPSPSCRTLGIAAVARPLVPSPRVDRSVHPTPHPTSLFVVTRDLIDNSTLFQRSWASHHHIHMVYWYTTFTRMFVCFKPLAHHQSLATQCPWTVKSREFMFTHIYGGVRDVLSEHFFFFSRV